MRPALRPRFRYYMALMSVSSPWWNPEKHADRRPLLLARGRIKSAIRARFEAEGFVEVDTACLQISPGNETHLHAFKTEAIGTDMHRRDFYLNTSPEFAMKKLLAAGEQKIFTFAPVFRNREQGNLHTSEFTMLEWYRAGAPYEQLFDDCAHFLKIAADVSENATWQFRGRTCDVRAPYQTLPVDDAFAQHADVALHETYDAHRTDCAALAQLIAAQGIRFAGDETWSDLFSRVLTDKVEPKLGSPQPTILCEYPVHEAALARRSPNRPSVAERFELYACGVELANGFGELTDAAEQRRRFDASMDDKQRIYGERYPIDEDFMAALQHMPPASGCALGFDRLVMLATGAERIDQVLWTPMTTASEAR